MALALGGLAVGNANCAEERAPIDRTQPGRVDKSFFVGTDLRSAQDDPEFYINNYVVDAPTSQSLVPVGTYDDVDRIRWEIQEDVLLARKAYEYVQNSDGHGVRGRTETGIVVAAYAIQSHFDVRRAYNPTTGEEINVIEENMSDRPWYDRAYMRVDWANNLVDNPGWGELFYGAIFGDLSFQPVRYYEQNPRSPNAPNFCEMTAGQVRDPATGLCVAATNPRNHPGGYFDVTSKWLVNPETSNAFGEALPTCLVINFFTGSNVYDCNPQETTIRTSFRKVVDRDFEPLELTRQPYDIVGGPRATRNGYDPNYGTTDLNFHRYQMIHNIWQQSHLSPAVSCSVIDGNHDGVVDGNVDANHDGTADQCESAHRPGSQCDVVVGKCTIPYREREVHPITYYVNPEMPPEFQDHVETAGADGALAYRAATDAEMQSRTAAGGGTFVQGPTEDIVDTWDIAVRRAVANAREVECRRVGPANGGGDRATCHAKYFESAQVPMRLGAFLGDNPKVTPAGSPAVARGVALCHNPVRPSDNAACREVGYSVRLGDIRYNHITYWSGDTRAPFGGIAHWGFDPLSGEIVSNGAFNVGRSVEYAAAQQRDYIRMILNAIDPALDDLTVAAFTENDATHNLAQYLRNPTTGGVGGIGQQTNLELINARAQSPDAMHASTSLNTQGVQGVDTATLNRQLIQMQSDTVPAGNGGSQTAQAFERQANLIRGSQYEAAMIDQDWLRHAGFDPNAPMTAQALDQVSLLRHFDPEVAASVRQRLQSSLEARGFCFQDAGAPPLVGSVDMQGVARWFANHYSSLTPAQRDARIMQDLRIDAYKGIALHEVGHSMGLYHLPVSSYDSPNYDPQYWQLRTREGAAARSCRADSCVAGNCPSVRNADRNMDNCMGPRYLDPETDEELGIRDIPAGNHHAGINYFGNTSTMEYQWERFGETVGAGAYDMYAMGVLYGRVIETMDDDTHGGIARGQAQRAFAYNLTSNLTEKYIINYYDPGLTTAAQRVPGGENLSLAHYTEVARQMKVFDPSFCRDATPEEIAFYRWRIVDGKICSHAPRDHAAMSTFESTPTYYADGDRPDPATIDPTQGAPYWRVADGTPDGGNVVSAGNGALRWRYRVAWDRGTGYPHINYFDQGADIYEVSRSITRKYDLLYPAMYFRRGNREWQSWGVANRAAQFFRLVRGYHWNVARDYAFYRGGLNDATFAIFANDDNALGPTVGAQTEMFDFFTRVLMMPEPGDYQASSDASSADDDRRTPELRAANVSIFDPPSNPTAPVFSVGLVNGRYIGDQFDNARGGSLDYLSYQIHEGASAEKSYAAIMLTDTRPTFSTISRALYLDGREYQVNFATDIPGALDRFLGGVLSEDWATVSMHAPRPATAGAEVTPQQLQLYRDVVPARPAGAALMFPNIGYRQQLPTIIYAMLFSSLNTDLTLINKMRIWTEGAAETVQVPEAERIRFTNPETGIVYTARRYGADPGMAMVSGGRTIERGIASRMIQHANTLLADAYQVQRDGSNNPLLGADGQVTMVRDAQGQLVPGSTSPQRQSRHVTAYRNYVGVIDATRHISQILGYGLLY